MASKDLAKNDRTEIELYSTPVDVETLDFDRLATQADVVTLPGFNLMDKDDLLGVPLFIVKVVYQVAGFVSVHAFVKDAPELDKARAKGRMVNDKVDPRERVVFNDGSTGVRRQLTKLFHNWGLLNVGKPESDGDARFDTPWQEWAEFTQSERLGSKDDAPVVPSFTRALNGNNLVISTDYGLYASTYTTKGVAGVPDGTDAVTYYLR